MRPECQQHTRSQRGVALVVSLLFLLVITLLSVAAARNGAFNLKMSGNMQDMARSFQLAEAGAAVALALPADGSLADPLDLTAPPVQSFNATDVSGYVGDLGSATLAVRVVRLGEESPYRDCPRGRDMGGDSDFFECVYYRAVAEHNDDGRSRTRVQTGIVKTTLQSR
jgi:hypothetical protein